MLTVVVAMVAAMFGLSNSESTAVASDPTGTDSVAFVGGGRFDVWVEAVQDSDIGRLYFGDAGDIPLMGDWDCDGVDSPGVYRASLGRVYLRNNLSSGSADVVFSFGIPGDIPLAGDFDGDGCDSVSVYRPSQGRVFISNSLRWGSTEYSFYFGVPGDAPFVGDFDGDGVDSIGLYRVSTGLVYFRNRLTAGVASWSFMFGNPGDRIIAGDWDGDGIDTVAVYRPSNGVLYLKNTNRTGIADASVSVGSHQYAVAVSGIPASIANTDPFPGNPPPADPSPGNLPPADPSPGNLPPADPSPGNPPPADPPSGQVYVPDVHVYPGDDLAGLADAWPAGTVFMIHGEFSGQEVVPKDGQVFVGAGDAVLDGGGWAEFAFSGSASGVVVQGLVIRNYDTPTQYGTVYVSGSGWLVEGNDISGSSGAGVSVRDGSFVVRDNVIRNNRIHHNDQLGLAVTGSIGTVVDGNEIAFNNWLGEYNWGWEAGATKFWETTNLVVRGNWSHDNDGPGLWADTDNVGTIYEGNVIEDNVGPGIFHEVGGSATIRNNVIRRNGFGSSAWLWGGGIVIAASDNIDIYGNRLENNFNGISLIQQDREHGHVVADVSVWNNILIDTGRSGAVTDTGDDSIFYANNWFNNNTYYGDVGWAWNGNNAMDWSGWLDTGNDPNGTYNP